MRRFLAIFFPPAKWQKISIVMKTQGGEMFSAGFKVPVDEGWRAVMNYSFFSGKKKEKEEDAEKGGDDEKEEEEQGVNPELLKFLGSVKKGSVLELSQLEVKEGETSPPKRYNSGSIILAMENAGSLIEDEELREQIKGSGIGTSATRAEILKKLINNRYLKLNKKTQIITPAQLGEMVYEVVRCSIPQMLNPELTASWEKGLTMVANGDVSENEYMEKLTGYVRRRTDVVKGLSNANDLGRAYRYVAQYYK